MNLSINRSALMQKQNYKNDRQTNPQEISQKTSLPSLQKDTVSFSGLPKLTGIQDALKKNLLEIKPEKVRDYDYYIKDFVKIPQTMDDVISIITSLRKLIGLKDAEGCPRLDHEIFYRLSAAKTAEKVGLRADLVEKLSRLADDNKKPILSTNRMSFLMPLAETEADVESIVNLLTKIKPVLNDDILFKIVSMETIKEIELIVNFVKAVTKLAKKAEKEGFVVYDGTKIKNMLSGKKYETSIDFNLEQLFNLVNTKKMDCLINDGGCIYGRILWSERNPNIGRAKLVYPNDLKLTTDIIEEYAKFKHRNLSVVSNIKP